MADYSLTNKATADLEDIYDYSITMFGLDQARSYVLGLHRLFKTLAENPTMGRPAEVIGLDIRRLEYRSHVTFYREGENAVEIIRVLHKSRDVPSVFSNQP